MTDSPLNSTVLRYVQSIAYTFGVFIIIIIPQLETYIHIIIKRW